MNRRSPLSPETPHQGLTLRELLQRVSSVVNSTFATPVWVVAELTDVREGAAGHCYMQLIEKDAKRGTTLATLRANIWASRWWLIKDAFLQQTGQPFQTGLKVMVLGQVTMHEQYGLSLNILDIDPTYTLGEMARRRLEILRHLEADGIIDMNRELPFPTLPQRIAVISAEGAAGYGDFMKQLANNSYGLKFYCHLFPAIMQGEKTEQTVIAALDRINEAISCFDVVVIIRGGGATVDLASFDSEPLAVNVANFPLPVITGIGHDRDQTVLDRVAHTSVKTPTAAAAFLIDTLYQQLQHIEDLQQALIESTEGRMDEERERIQHLANAVRGTHTTLQQNIARMDMTAQRIQMIARQRIQREEDRLEVLTAALPRTRERIRQEQNRLQYLSQTIQMAQPDNILRRGFSITRLNGHAVKSASSVPSGSELHIQTADGELVATRK